MIVVVLVKTRNKRLQQLRVTDGLQQQSLRHDTLTPNFAHDVHIFHSDDHQDDTNYKYENPLATPSVSMFHISAYHSHAEQDVITDAQTTSNPAYGILHQ